MKHKILTLAVCGVTLVAAGPIIAKERPYSGFSEKFLEQARDDVRNQDGLLLKCTFNRKCVGETCESVTKHSELMATYMSKEDAEDSVFPQTSVLSGLWFGPDDSSDARVITIDENLTGMIFGMGNGVALFSSSVNGGTGIYSVHSKNETQVTTYFGACKRQD